MRQLRGRPKKKKKVVQQEEEEEGWWKHRYRVGVAVLGVSLLVGVAYWWTVAQSLAS